jgi:AraC family transcriptional regulator of adaptative response/methylated-DNA-[protein]-cysteine methyltransferase
MNTENVDYQRITEAIQFLERNVSRQPGLEELATALKLSPFHCQRLFRRWAGVSPKRFLQFLTVAHAKRLLDQSQSVLNTAYATGLSGPARLHDHFVSLEAVTPGEYKHKGSGLYIRYGVHPSPFGPMFLAVTQRGICALAFVADTQDVGRELAALEHNWNSAAIHEDRTATEAVAARVFACEVNPHRPLKLLVKGSNFQIQVWKALLAIPPGWLCSYRQIAYLIDQPAAFRAVGQAISANPVGYLIPCHRVIRGMGTLGGYRWGTTRKQALLAWEAAHARTETIST